MSSSSPAEVAALVHALKELFGTCLIGFTIGTTLYGISVLQTFFYFRAYVKDPWVLKATIASLWTLDTLSTILVAHSLYVYFVINFGESLALDLVIPWSFITEKLLVTIITFIAQIFYARTIWQVSFNKPVVAFIVILAVVSFGLGIVTTVHLFQNPLLTAISIREFSIISGLVQGFAALNDIVITGALCYFLHVKRSGVRSTGRIIDSLILYAVSRGILTAVAQIMFLILNVGVPDHTYWQPFHQAVGKLYVNSVVATLNVRKSLNAKDALESDVDMPEFNARTVLTTDDTRSSLHSHSVSIPRKCPEETRARRLSL